jgi:hypothetical protein
LLWLFQDSPLLSPGMKEPVEVPAAFLAQPRCGALFFMFSLVVAHRKTLAWSKNYCTFYQNADSRTAKRSS